MIGLFRKELRAVAPLGALASLLSSGDILYRPFLERLDEATWTEIASYAEPGDASSYGFILIILGTAVAYAAYPREHDERTIELLYALPIRRSSIFFAKASAGLFVLSCATAMLLVTDGVQSVLGPQSIAGHQWRLDLALELAALQAVFYFVVYGHALLASVLRLFGILPYAILLFMTSILEDRLPPLAWVDPREMLVARYHGTELVVAWAGIAGHVAVALCAYGLAYLAWMGPAERIGRALERVRASIAGKLALGCVGAVGVGFVALVALGLLIGGGLPSDEESDDEPAIQAKHGETERYDFTYPAAFASRAEPLMRDADALHEEVRRRLDADPGPRLVADLTDTSGEHLGISSWTHVRVGVTAERDPVRLRRTFAHETAHVFQHRLTDGRLGDRANATRFFAEGSAEYLSFVVVPGDEALADSRRIAAATWTRHRMRFEDLADDDRLRARFDPVLVYPLGELWTAALTRTCGDGAIGAVLRAIGRGDAPRELAARAFWEDRLRAAGCDLEAVLASFEGTVRAIAERERDAIEALPRIGGGVAGWSGSALRVVAVLDREASAGATYALRVRTRPDAGDTEIVGIEGVRDDRDPRRVVFEVHPVFLASSRVQLLFSVLPDERGWAFSETWQWASVPAR